MSKRTRIYFQEGELNEIKIKRFLASGVHIYASACKGAHKKSLKQVKLEGTCSAIIYDRINQSVWTFQKSNKKKKKIVYIKWRGTIWCYKNNQLPFYPWKIRASRLYHIEPEDSWASSSYTSKKKEDDWGIFAKNLEWWRTLRKA